MLGAKESTPYSLQDTVKISAKDCVKYQTAFNRIASEICVTYRDINVSHVLMGTAYIFFEGVLKPDKTMEDLYILDEKSRSTLPAYIDFTNLFPDNNESRYVLSFSEIVGGDLFGEVKDRRWNNSFFGNSIVFFFRFNEDGTISFVYKRTFDGL